MADDDSDILRSALDRADADSGFEPVSRSTPLEQLRDLAEHGQSEAARVQALRLLLEREDEQRERRRRERERREGSEDEPNFLGVGRLSGEELDANLDSANAALIYSMGVDKFPQTVNAVCSALGREHFERLRQELQPPLPPEPLPPEPAPEPPSERRAERDRPEAIQDPQDEPDAADASAEEPRGPSWKDDAWKLERGFSD